MPMRDEPFADLYSMFAIYLQITIQVKDAFKALDVVRGYMVSSDTFELDESMDGPTGILRVYGFSDEEGDSHGGSMSQLVRALKEHGLEKEAFTLDCLFTEMRSRSDGWPTSVHIFHEEKDERGEWCCMSPAHGEYPELKVFAIDPKEAYDAWHEAWPGKKLAS